MAYTVAQLITNAYYASGIVSREFETVQGYQLGAGLEFLNEIIADKTVDNGDIPYFQRYEFNGVIGQEKYFVPNLIQVETAVFFIDSVRFSMYQTARNVYFGSPRADNVTSLPFNYHVERQFKGADIYMYFKPDQSYMFQIWGQFRLPQVTYNQDLTTSETKVNLGVVSSAGTGTLAPGALVINGIDLDGSYGVSQPAINLAAVINSDVPNVTATVNLGSLTLTTTVANGEIHITTSGSQDPADYLTFYNFNTLAEPLDQTFFPLQLDQFYINFLRYQLAVRLCAEFNFDVPPGVAKQLDYYEGVITKKSATMDLHTTKISMMSYDHGGPGIYGMANLGHGWVP